VWHHGMTAPKKAATPPLSIPGCAGRCTSRRKPSTAPATTSGGCCASRTRRAAGDVGHADGAAKGDGSDLRGELLAMGLEIDPAARNHLARYLQERAPKKRVRCALQVGWCGCRVRAAGCGNRAGCGGRDFPVRRTRARGARAAGTLDGWRAEIAARAVGNPLFALALSAAFAGPLLEAHATPRAAGCTSLAILRPARPRFLKRPVQFGAGRAIGGAGGQPPTAWKARRRCSMIACSPWTKSANATRAKSATSSIRLGNGRGKQRAAEPARRGR
jgi:hypothetical protein